MIIDGNQLSSAHNISNTTTFETTNKQPPHKNRPKRLLLKASSYLSIGQYIRQRIPQHDAYLAKICYFKIYSSAVFVQHFVNLFIYNQDVSIKMSILLIFQQHLAHVRPDVAFKMTIDKIFTYLRTYGIKGSHDS